VAKRLTPSVASGWFLVTILLPCWWASEQILRRALRAREA